MSFKKGLIGGTIKMTWINSGVTMNPKVTAFTGSETVVATGDMVDSGNGHYYYNFTIPSSGFYNLVAIGSAGGYPYKRNEKVKGVTGGVD